MIASHNSMSYLRGKGFFNNLFSRFWRCQDKTITEQINSGVKFFDLRVMSTKLGMRFACGKIELVGESVNNVIDLLEEKKLHYRVIFERGNVNNFMNWVGYMTNLRRVSHCIDFSVKKNNTFNIVKYQKNDFVLIDNSFFAYIPTGKDTKLCLTPKSWAKEYNSITKWKRYEKNRVYFYDFV